MEKLVNNMVSYISLEGIWYVPNIRESKYVYMLIECCIINIVLKYVMNTLL